ncbi:MAG: Hsp33 family molecular chaperone HslO [Sulfobacillus acidophilus]|uniref:33 kDa chaperonin n=1 Tax=Sulfobacillus acidophilus TaxID=53633 RepID=A0A2T2WF03_9FIRM|nr:MAG: Hsp33 family molecular chaperone HslO [Sulfobacillus acidophilus]
MGTDYRIRATAAGGLLRTVAVIATDAVERAQQIHRAWPVAAAAMGRLMTCAAMVSADIKQDGGRMTVEVDGDGPVGRVVAEIQPNGAMRARIQNPSVDLPITPEGKLAVGQAVGQHGVFRVLHEDAEEWYQSQVALKTGEIGDDFLHYLVQSEQIPSAVSLGVLVRSDGTVIGAGGVMVQALPGCPAEIIDSVSQGFENLTQISRRLADGDNLESLIREVLPEPIFLYPRESLAWHCWCERTTIAHTLGSLPRQDLGALIADGGAEVTCHFCRTAYRFSASQLRRLRDGVE